MLSGVYRYMTGQAWGRTAQVTGFAQGSQRIRIEPQGTRRADAINRLDFRLEKTLPIRRYSVLSLPTLGGSLPTCSTSGRARASRTRTVTEAIGSKSIRA